MGRLAISISALLVSVAGCSGPGSPMHCNPGAEGCACAEGDACLTGLVCRSGTCVSPGGGADSGAHALDGGAGHHPGHDAGHPVAHDAGMPDSGTAYCGPDGGMSGMATECGSGPVPGCPCETPGETQTCANGRTITCSGTSEFPTWSACTGSCFSSGTWHIDNLTPCLISDGTGATYAFSSHLDGSGNPACASVSSLPPPMPTEDWSANELQVDCQGQFMLCYTIKAGDASAPLASDCTVAQVCTSAYYAEANMMQTLPSLGPWLSDDPSCAASFLNDGGYGEMSVVGVTIDCQSIGATGHPYVFNRVPYCPVCCGDDSCGSSFDCTSCMTGGSGGF